MDDGYPRDTGRLASAVGMVAAGSAICLATYFIVGGPFGTINDIGNAATAVLSGALAWRLRDLVSGRARGLALSVALVGAAISVAGSALVISGATGFFFAGLVSSVGFAGIGAWLVIVSRSEATAAWPGGLRRLGAVAGGLMALGVVTAPGIILRLDDMASAPGWIWVGFLGWLGTFVVYPAWALWLGLARPDVAPAGRQAIHAGIEQRADDRAVQP
jgi:hypothetical protein